MLNEAVRGLETQDECSEAWDVVKERWNRLQQIDTLNFDVGDPVKWTSRKFPFGVNTGVVEKINKKSVGVLVGKIHWKVTPSLLRKQVGTK